MLKTGRLPRATYLFPLLAALAFCPGNRSLPTRNTTTPITLTSTDGIGQRDFASAGEAMRYLIQQHNPQVIGFGEYHNQYLPDHRSTSEYFASEIIPVLQEAGFTDLINEFLPDHPAVYSELAQYKTTGQISSKTPNLHILRTGFDGRGAIQIIDAAQSSGMTLHGGNLPGWGKTLPRNVRRRRIDLLIHDQVKRLRSRGQRVAVYSGADHNNDEQNRSSATHLSLDIITGDMLNALPNCALKRNYLSQIPQTGAHLIEQGPRSYVLLIAPSPFPLDNS